MKEGITLRASVMVLAMLAAALTLAGCAGAPPRPSRVGPFVAAHRIPGPPLPVKIIKVPEPLPLPGQLKPSPTLVSVPDRASTPGPQAVVREANRAALIEPDRSTFVNATQVWPYARGALYQIYTSPERVTDIALEPGESLISVSAGDTVRWVIGDTASGSGAEHRVHILVKPIETGLHTNLVIDTSRRTYHLELTSTPETWMASVSWDYPLEQLIALRATDTDAERAAPVAQHVDVSRLNFGYAISGDSPSWRPVRAFDDGERVYIEFPPDAGEGQMPPLFVVGPQGQSELVNYRVDPPYYIVDRLFGEAELRLGGKKQQVVRITRTDLKPDPRQKGRTP